MLKKKYRIKMISWETGANIATVLGVLLTFIFGLYQFKKSIERTDEQIRLIKQERIQKQEEERPVIIPLQTSGINVDPQNNLYQVEFSLQNIGKRPGFDLVYSYQVINMNAQRIQSNNTSQKFETVNPIAPGQTFNGLVEFRYVEGATYYFKISISYFDRLSEKLYQDDFYYRYQLNINVNPIISRAFTLQKNELESLNFHQ